MTPLTIYRALLLPLVLLGRAQRSVWRWWRPAAILVMLNATVNFRIGNGTLPQPQYHFTKYEYGLEAREHFNPDKPRCRLQQLNNVTAHGGGRIPCPSMNPSSMSF